MNKISRSLIASVVVLLLIPVVALANGNGTTVTRFADQEFGFFQCVPQDDVFPGVPLRFGVDVCTDYQGTWSQTVTVKAKGDVAWTTSNLGTATFFADNDGPFNETCGTCVLLGVGEYKQDEIGRDLGGDADCLRDFPVGAAGAEDDACVMNWGTEEGGKGKLDFLELHFKVTFEDEMISYNHVQIHGFDKDGFTKWCIWSAIEGFGSNCPPGVDTSG